MKDLKIRVANEAESKEAQELFFELGYYWAYKNLGKKLLLSKKDVYLFAESDGTLGTGTHQDKVFFNNWRGKEITIQELRDMVNPMKEYLEPSNNYSLIKAHRKEGNDWIEVPDGADIYVAVFNNNFFYKDNFKYTYRDKWVETAYCDVNLEIRQKMPVLWQRHTQPEELPFIDSLNDQYAEIEQVRKHRHYFKDVSNIAEIDVYAVLKLFDVTDPCLQHIVKKALCAGKRGHKDMMEDLQNIVDTAIRAVELNS